MNIDIIAHLNFYNKLDSIMKKIPALILLLSLPMLCFAKSSSHLTINLDKVLHKPMPLNETEIGYRYENFFSNSAFYSVGLSVLNFKMRFKNLEYDDMHAVGIPISVGKVIGKAPHYVEFSAGSMPMLKYGSGFSEYNIENIFANFGYRYSPASGFIARIYIKPTKNQMMVRYRTFFGFSLGFEH